MSNNDKSILDLETLIQNDTGRKLFAQFLKELNNSSDNLFTLYLICCCFQNQRIDDRHKIKQILEKTYQTCFVKNQLPYLNQDLKQKLCDSLKKCTYNESIFKAVRKELKNILEYEYFPLFLKSKLYNDNLALIYETAAKIQFDDVLNEPPSHSYELKTSKSQFAIPANVQKSSNSKNFKTNSSSSISNQQPPVTPSTRSNKLNKTSSHISTSSKSINTLNESTLSLNVHKSSSRHRDNLPPNPYHVITKAIPVSCQDSELQSVVSGDVQFEDQHGTKTHRGHYSKLDKHIKQNLLANKNAKLNMPEFQPSYNQDEPTVPLKNNAQNNNNSKKSQIPLSESDPRKFFEIVSSKLEQYINEQTFDSNENGRHFKQRSLSNSNLNQMHEFETNNSRQALFNTNSYQVESIDSQLDEHLDRVYNNNSNINKNNSINLINMSKASPKMCTKTNDYSFNHNSNLRGSNLSLKFNNLSISSNQGAKHQTKPQQHHFYQLTSTSKEVDIDSQNHHNHHNRHHKVHDGYDSGVASTRSVASIERVNDWLTSSAQNNQKENSDDVYEAKNKFVKENLKNVSISKKLDEEQLKTTVAYYLPGEDLAYISTFNGKYLTLAQFKQLITKKGQFRYFFKTKSDLLDEECIVYQEATDENAYVPMFNNKVIAKIEKIKE